MKLADTILVALQASMGLALVLPNDDMKKALTQHKHNDAEPDEKKFHGYETITKITSHRYFGVKDHKHHHEEKKHDDDDDTDDDDDDDGREEHSNQPQKAKEKHKNDDDGHKEHHSHDFKKKQHDEEDDDKDEDKNKNKNEKPKLIFPTEEFKKAKKKHEEEFPRLKDHAWETPKSDDKSKSLEDAVEKIKKETKQKLPFENIVLETPKRYNKHRNEEKQVKEDKKEQTNSRDGKMYNFIHRNGMDVKRDIDINIHAPTYKIYHNSDKKHGHGDAELIKIFHVSSEESTHETKDHKYKHDGEQKHKEPTKEHHSFPKSHHKNVESKNYDGHDKGHFGSEKKYPQSSKGRNQTQGHRHTPVVQVTKKILELIGPLLKKEDGSHGSSKKPSHQYKSYPSHVYSDKGRPSPHDNRYPDNQNTHHGDKPKNGHEKSDQAEKEKNDALRRIIESLADLLAKKEAPKHHLKKTHPSEDDHDSHHESEKKHHSHKRPSYPYKEHAEYKHDDNKKHAKLSQDSSSHYEPGYNHEEVDSHHAKKQNAYYHDHEDSKKGQYSHNKPISQYEKKINDKHDDEKNYIKVIKDRDSQHKPTLHNEKPDHHHHHHHHHHDKDNEHAKRPKPHHNHQEAEHHGDSKKSEDYYPYNKPKHQFEEQSKHNHDDDNERGPFYQRVKMDRKPINYFPKSGHHKDHEDETKAYKDHQSRLETHIKRSSNLVPKLNTTQILNLEALSPQDRKRIAMGLPLDSQTRKEFGEFKDCTPKLITKLNVMYARIVDDPKYAPFIKYLNTERKFHNRKRSASVLTPEMLAKIEAMPPMMRTLAADQLDFGPELKKEFIKEGKLSPGLIRKLEKEYERIAKNPKYKKILEKLKSNGKRAAPNPPPPKIPNEMLKKIEAMDPILRRFLAEKLDLPAKLTDEFVDCGKLDQAMIHKINWEYARIHKDPKYKKILQEFNTKSKRSKGQDENTKDELITLTDDEKEKVAKPKEKVEADEPQRLTEQQLAVLANMPKLHRREVAKKIGMPKDLAKWFVKTKKFTGENLERLNEEWIRVQLDPKYEDVVKSLKHLAVKGNNKARKDKIRKRSVHQLTEKELERVLKLDKYERQALARRLGLDQSLAREFINASKPNTDLLEKLNEAVSKSVGTPQYQELLKLVGKEFPKPKNEELKLESIKKEVRLEIAKSLDFDEFTRDEFLEAKELKGRLLDKVTKYWGVKRMKNAEQGKDDVKHSEVINKLLGSALDKAGQSGDDLRSKGTDGKKLTEAEQKMKDKLEKTKENGWCDEFVSELEDAWGPKKEKEGERRKLRTV